MILLIILLYILIGLISYILVHIVPDPVDPTQRASKDLGGKATVWVFGFLWWFGWIIYLYFYLENKNKPLFSNLIKRLRDKFPLKE